ncbi:MAG: DUF6476 family protein [Pseudomonadota bacterium]
MTDANRQTDATDVPETATTGGTSPRQLFWLKVLVGGLGAMMLLVMIIIITRIVYLTAYRDRGPDPTVAVPIRLPTGAKPGSISLSREHLAIRYQHDGKTWIDVRNIKTGNLLRRFELQVGK